MLDQVLQIIFDCWKFDIEAYKHWWMYAPLCIPAIAYTVFFFFKWAVLTAPIWLPLSFIAQSFRSSVQIKR